MDKIRILIVDDHQVVRKGLVLLFEDENDIEIVGEACDGVEAIEKIKNLQPDIAILDISMPKMSGIDVASWISKNAKKTRSIIFSMHHNEDYILKSIESGAFGYVLKDTSKDILLSTIRSVFRGEKYFTPQVSGLVINSLIRKSKKSKKDPSNYQISAKEKIILKHLVSGKNSREIAESLDLSIRTVDNHRARLMKKTGAKNAVELVRLALQENLA